MKDSKATTKADDKSAQVPRHIGFIMDGNRRWAEENKIPKMQAHKLGYQKIKDIAEHAFDAGIEFMSIYAFSTENWKRSKEEVDYLMELALFVATNEVAELHQKGYKTIFIGTEEGLDPKIVKAIRNAEEKTKDNTNGTLVICFNYGGHKEIVDATKKIIQEGIQAKDVTEEVIAEHLYAPEVPPIDLLIRTSGEMRISNYMLWRISYSEFLFEDVYWPAYSTEDLDRALKTFAKRNRRLGADKPSK